MSDIAIKVENLSKLYRLGEIGTGTLSKDLNRWWAQFLGQDDPYAKISEINDRTKKITSEYVWALKNIDFELKKGEVLGIIGRNGAGKSTLLKILSKITSPTSGKIKINGRIASLLEVGTGFHPELSGRDNIFMNGAILGMRKWEIQKKIEEIVDFSGVEAYINTPVKRYSSGMYVRLAFAVAAFLEPEILIVDEVLAVGDGEFQKKCLGRMKDVSLNEGRTVLFVSHNMAAVQNLCNHGILIANGIIEFKGKIHNVIENYVHKGSLKNKINYLIYKNRKGNSVFKVKNILLFQKGKDCDYKVESLADLSFLLEYKILENVKLGTSRVDIGINDIYGTRVAWFSTWNQNTHIRQDKSRLIFVVKNFNLSPGEYTCNVYCEINGEVADWLENVCPFTVIEKDYYNTGKKYHLTKVVCCLNIK